MMMKIDIHIRHYVGLLAACSLLIASNLLTSCAIENDIPYPIVDGSVTAIEMEGQCDAEGNSSTQATINKEERTVQLYVDDTVDLTKARIKRLSVSNGATIRIDSAYCYNPSKFPTTGWESIDQLTSSADTRINCSRDVPITLSTYQDYDWVLRVKRIVNRSIVMENQIGNAVIDPDNRVAVVYVSSKQSLSKIAVSKFDLGGPHGTVVPDPTSSSTYDFSEPTTFFVQNGWEEMSYRWTVYVYTKEEEQGGNATAFARTTQALLNGSVQSGKSVSIDYRTTNSSQWSVLPASDITTSGTSFSATLSGLKPATTYVYRVSVGGVAGEEQQFTTAPATQLTDGSLDNWHQVDKLWNPWAQGGTSYWDTGNRGATTVGNSNSVPTDDTATGSGQAALLESKWIVLKFAAGNIFTGTYVKTVGTNGVLDFGREFSSFPTKLRFSYKCAPVPIDKVGEDSFEYLKGRMDTCHIYTALGDWDEPVEIRTRPSERKLLDRKDPNMIAFGEMMQGQTISQWTTAEITYDYRSMTRTPRYIIVVASASKYGDYFTGGVGTKLWVDNFELVYE
ncbi:MAG: PCMD domain-containing protein [Mediterranea sp.]|nr:PCMD domain-containing protein [Mediterranea sp.]